jgi:hypothetical protein
LKVDGKSYIQMANKAGLRSFYNSLRNPHPKDFNVRYWKLSDLRKAFSAIGNPSVEADGFFGLGIQPSDLDLLPLYARIIVRCSEVLRHTPLTRFADSVYFKTPKVNGQKGTS